MSIQNLTTSSHDRAQMVEESGVISGIKGNPEARKVLELIEDYEGATPERLNHARSELIKASHGMDQYPIDHRELSLRIINDYVGFDEVQADEMQVNLSTLVFDEQMDKFFSEGHCAPDEEPFFRDLALLLQNKVASLPMAHSTSRVEMDIDNVLQTEMLSTLLDATKQFIEENMSRVPLQKREEFAKTLDEITSVKKEHNFNAYSSALKETYSPQTILKLDRGHMIQLIKEIVLTQKKCAASLPPLTLKEGTSRSITYTIKKDGQLRGYLFGTAHYLGLIPGGKRLTKITKEVQSRLYDCAILGTEINMSKEEISPSNSIDETLVENASSRAIPHIGIDAEDRDNTFADLVSDMQQAKKNNDEERYDELMFEVQEHLHAVHDGDIEKFRTSNEKRTHSKKMLESMSSRNKEMADNIDVLLSACATVGKDLGENPPKAFFAVGCDHIVATKHDPNSVAELLAKKGWTVELLK